MAKDVITIKEAAEMLGVSMQTLRRWDESGKLIAIRPGKGTHRLYRTEDITLLTTDLFSLAKMWIFSDAPKEPDSRYYCSNSGIFQFRLHAMESELLKLPAFEHIFSFISSTAGEIGNNSFDHNLGSWPDIPGNFFGYDLGKRMVIIADRGQGILHTLRRVRPNIPDDTEALKVSFTEVLTGRAPEHRGNGLKYVRKIITSNPMNLVFQTGDAKLTLQQGDTSLNIEKTKDSFHGCLALIRF